MPSLYLVSYGRVVSFVDLRQQRDGWLVTHFFSSQALSPSSGASLSGSDLFAVYHGLRSFADGASGTPFSVSAGSCFFPLIDFAMED